MLRHCILVLGFVLGLLGRADAQPVPLLAKGQSVHWFFAYKFNTRSFPNCTAAAARSCPFGGHPIEYPHGFGQQYVVASSADPHLKMGGGCLGDTDLDPVGATFDEIYNGNFNYLVWNHQFYNDPHIAGCGQSCSSPWGHSKGVLAWDDTGAGLVMQVTTPSWPGSGSALSPRIDGNTLGCVHDNNVLVAQHFFATRLVPEDVVAVATALINASIVTNPNDLQIVKNGGPPAISNIVATLGVHFASEQLVAHRLAAVPQIQILSKPSRMHAPPWHLVSSLLGSIDLRVATWWNHGDIPDTAAGQVFECWPTGLRPPGAVVNAERGHWDATALSLLGIGSGSGNHAKIGVSMSGNHPYAIFGDLNQEGALSGACGAKQNGRGGTFYVVEDKLLHDGVATLISDR